MRYILLIVSFTILALAKDPIPAADRPELYIPLLKDKRVALVVNHSSLVGDRHLVDSLLENGINVSKIFAPEHGFRGKADAGAQVQNSRDIKSGIPIISLYGKHKKPTSSDLAGVDLILFDIQDVGVRFYTYLSTLHYVMESAAKEQIPIVVLDRPNPNGHYVDGPVLKKEYSSFVGLDPVPIVYGMTIAEYAKMLNGEGWLEDALKANLTVIPLDNYSHDSFYSLPIKPSPNLPTDRSVALYPSLALFEGTVFSAGRGTPRPFERYGHPNYSDKRFSFVPNSQDGAKYPKFEGKRCYGVDLSGIDLKQEHANQRLNLSYIYDAYNNSASKRDFFLKNRFIDRLWGSDELRKHMLLGDSEEIVRKGWQKDLEAFKQIRKKYLLYP